MLKLSNSSILKIVTKILILLVFAKAISLALWWYLPSDGVELSKKANHQPKYQRVDFKAMIKQAKVTKKSTGKNTSATPGTAVSITNMILKGLYGNENSGFVIVALKSKPKATSIIEVGEAFAGFTLKSIRIDSAIFTEASKEYILELSKSKNKSSFINKVNRQKTPRRGSKSRVREDDSADVIQKDVTRADINAYAKNPKQIWKDIGIKEIKKGKKIDGFRVTRINPKSKMATLGLKKGDIIISANNIMLQSYKDALDLYKNINKLDTIQIVVIRNNQEKELVYEIN